MFKQQRVGMFFVTRHADPSGRTIPRGFEGGPRYKDHLDRAYCDLERPESIEDAYRSASILCSSISIDPRVQSGKPCIAGTRIPVHLVLWAVEHKGSIAGAIKSYPDLTAQQIKDALYFAEIILGSPKNVNSEVEAIAR